MELIANLSSIATLITFIIYFIGRAMTIRKETRLLKDKIEMPVDQTKDEIYANYNIVEDVFDLDEKGNQIIPDEGKDFIYGVLQSVEGIWNIKIFKVESDRKNIPRKKGKKIFHKDFLNIGEAIAIHVEPGDLFPSIIIEYSTYDFKRISLGWRDNLKDGVVSEIVEPKNTLKSLVYYLCR